MEYKYYQKLFLTHYLMRRWRQHKNVKYVKTVKIDDTGGSGVEKLRKNTYKYDADKSCSKMWGLRKIVQGSEVTPNKAMETMTLMKPMHMYQRMRHAHQYHHNKQSMQSISNVEPYTRKKTQQYQYE